MKQSSSGLEKLAEFTQFGVSLLTPLVLLILLARWLVGRGWGEWTYLVAFVLGIGSMGSTFYNFYKKHTKQSGTKPPTSFNEHK